MTLKLINGKFIRDGVEEKPEIGNSEQIALLKHQELLFDWYKEGMGVDYEPDDFDCINSVHIDIDCLCGHPIRFEVGVNEGEDYEDLLKGLKKTCPVCKRRYILDEDEDFLLIVKFDT